MFFVQKDPLTGDAQRVTDEGRAKVQSLTLPIQAHVSAIEAQAYQVKNSYTWSGAGTVNLLHIKNTSTTDDVMITYMRLQVLDQSGGTALPSVNSYFEIGTNQTYTSGGTALTPINMNAGSSNAAAVTAYGDNPTLGGTLNGADEWYPTSDGDSVSYNKEGSFILPPGSSAGIRLVTDHTAGVAYFRMSFVMVPDSHLE